MCCITNIVKLCECGYGESKVELLWVGRLASIIDPMQWAALLTVHTTSNRREICSQHYSAVSHRLVLQIFPNLKQHTTASAISMSLLRNLKHLFPNFPHRLGLRNWIQSATFPLTLYIPIFPQIRKVRRNKTCFLSSFFPFQPSCSSIGTANSNSKIYAKGVQ